MRELHPPRTSASAAFTHTRRPAARSFSAPPSELASVSRAPAAAAAAAPLRSIIVRGDTVRSLSREGALGSAPVRMRRARTSAEAVRTRLHSACRGVSPSRLWVCEGWGGVGWGGVGWGGVVGERESFVGQRLVFVGGGVGKRVLRSSGRGEERGADT